MKNLGNLINGFEAAAPGFKVFLHGRGIEVNEDGEITNPDQVRMRYRRGKGGGGGGGGGGSTMGSLESYLIGIIVVFFLVYIILTLVADFTPIMGNLTYSGGGIGATIFGFVQTWVLPLGLLGLFILVIGVFLTHRKK